MPHPGSRSPLTRTAGWTAVAFGAIHTLVSPWETRDQWRKAAGEGWWHTFTLDPGDSLPEQQRSEAFWRSAGSFGVPMLALGSYVVWSERRGQRVPAWLGGTLLAWGLPMTVVLPRSPIWVVPAVGALLAIGDGGDGGDGDERGSASG